MALFQSGNPTLSEKIFNRTLTDVNQGTMTVRGAMNKFGFMLLLVVAGAVFTWRQFLTGSPESAQTFMFVGLFGGLVTGLIISFKPTTARYLAPAYAVLEGLLLGGLSMIVNASVGQKMPGIVPQAVGLTFAVAFAMFLLYNFRIIKPTQKFRAVITASIGGILLFYIAMLILSFFHVRVGFMSWTDASPLGIGLNIFIIAIAALSLILDFDMIAHPNTWNGMEHSACSLRWFGFISKS